MPSLPTSLDVSLSDMEETTTEAATETEAETTESTEETTEAEEALEEEETGEVAEAEEAVEEEGTGEDAEAEETEANGDPEAEDPAEFGEGEEPGERFPVAVDISNIPFVKDMVTSEGPIYFILSGHIRNLDMCRNVWDRLHAWESKAKE